MKHLDKTLNQFKDYVDGVRMIMLICRSKEGGKSNKPDRIVTRRISIDFNEFKKILKHFLEYQQEHPEYRIYSCVNKRDFNKGIREFKRQQLEADYYDEKSRNKFYLDVKNRFLGSLMKSSSRAETKFLIDADDLTRKTISNAINEIEKITNVLLHYKTKNGYHIITEPFNPNLLGNKFGEIKKDDLLLLSY